VDNDILQRRDIPEVDVYQLECPVRYYLSVGVLMIYFQWNYIMERCLEDGEDGETRAVFSDKLQGSDS
jgi:hypothetical protein